MCGRAYSPRFLFSWPNSRIGVMGGVQAAEVLATVKDGQRAASGEAPMSAGEREAFQKPTLDKFEREADPFYATARLWDDGVLDPRETRQVLAQCLRVCTRVAVPPTQQYGVFRM